jgi:hypothetical protein
MEIAKEGTTSRRGNFFPLPPKIGQKEPAKSTAHRTKRAMRICCE